MTVNPNRDATITPERIERLRERARQRRLNGYRDVPVRVVQLEKLLELAAIQIGKTGAAA